MPRATNNPATHRRRKKVLDRAKGFYLGRKNFRQAVETVRRAMSFAFRDRRAKKRQFRALWILRINAACHLEGMSYSRFMNGLCKANVELDRKILAELAVQDPAAFRELVGVAKKSLGL